MICPKCGSNRVHSQAVTETTTTGKTKGFGWIKSHALVSCYSMYRGSFADYVAWVKEEPKQPLERGLPINYGLLGGFGLFSFYILVFKKIIVR